MPEERPVAIVIVIGLAAAVAGGVVFLVLSGSGVGAGRAALPWVIVAVAGAVITAVVAALLIRRRQRPPKAEKTKHADAAAEHGLVYLKKAPRGFHRDFGPLPGIPHGGDVRHVMTGTLDGRPLTVFQHTYVVNTGQAVIPVHHAVYVTAAPDWPGVTVTRRGAGRLLYRLGLRRGLLLEDEFFNSRMKVKTDDEDFALTLLHPEMQQFMAAKDRVTWRVHADHVAMIYGGAIKPERLGASLERFRRFWALVPPELEAW